MRFAPAIHQFRNVKRNYSFGAVPTSFLRKTKWWKNFADGLNEGGVHNIYVFTLVILPCGIRTESLVELPRKT